MPLAFTQEDFLVLILALRCKYSNLRQQLFVICTSHTIKKYWIHFKPVFTCQFQQKRIFSIELHNLVFVSRAASHERSDLSGHYGVVCMVVCISHTGPPPHPPPNKKKSPDFKKFKTKMCFRSFRATYFFTPSSPPPPPQTVK